MLEATKKYAAYYIYLENSNSSLNVIPAYGSSFGIPRYIKQSGLPLISWV
jgi:hypothetical protein